MAAIEAAGGNAFARAGDVRDAARVQVIVEDVVARTQRIDVLINNAAGNFICPSERLSPNGFKSVVDIVLLGTFNCTRLAFEALRASQGFDRQHRGGVCVERRTRRGAFGVRRRPACSR